MTAGVVSERERWIGSLPDEWQVRRLKHLASISFSNVDKLSAQHERPALLCNYTEVYKNEEITADLNFMEATASDEEFRRFRLFPGDLIVTKDSETPDDIAVPAFVVSSRPDLLCGYHLAIIRANTDVEGKFLYYCFCAVGLSNQLHSAANGVTRFGLSQYALANSIFPEPPLATQQSVVAFLDKRTAAIDHLIASKQKMIALLRERRLAVIRQSVTKGLDSNAAMMETGIMWQPECPRHWTLRKLSWHFQIGSGTTPPTDSSEYYDGAYPWVNTAELRDGEIKHTRKSVTDLALRTFTSLKVYPVGTLLIALYGATIGKLGMLRVAATVNQACCALSNPRGIRTDFAFYWFLANREHIIALAVGGGQPNISQDIVRGLRIPLPSLNEQDEIVVLVETQCKGIDDSIASIHRQMELLREYRRTLITAAVTGKIDVTAETSGSA